MYKQNLKKNQQKKPPTFQGTQQKYTASPQCCSHVKDGFCGWFYTSPILSLWFNEEITVRQKFDNSKINVNSWVVDLAIFNNFFHGPTGQTATARQR